MKGPRLGIVGSEGAKFTKAGEKRAREMIRGLFVKYKPREVVSGKCHLGGIDVWAIEEARAAKIPVKEFPAEYHGWNGSRGYKARNMKIGKRADVTVCITVRTLPKDYEGMRFRYCYHCMTDDHVKSGGCWTTKYARLLGKKGYTLVCVTRRGS